MSRPFTDFPKPAQQIILAAERLIAERGLDGMSMREILREAGQANNSAIYSHFGSKEDLVRAIYDLRQFEMDQKRKARLDKLGPPAPGDAYAALGLILLPVMEVFDGKHRVICARFMLHLILADPYNPMFAAAREPESIHEINLHLRACFPGLPDDIFTFRYSLAVAHFLHGLIQHDGLVSSHAGEHLIHPRIWDDLLQSAVAVIAQPYPPLHHQRWDLMVEADPEPERVTRRPARAVEGRRRTSS